MKTEHVPDVITQSLRKSDDNMTMLVLAIVVALAIISLVLVPDVPL